jgi:hypothetical protein
VFIELAEFLRCPEPHELSNVVLVPEVMAGRDVVAGSVGCPVCRREYPILGGVAEFGGDSWPPGASPAAPPPDPHAVQALVGLESPGGYVVLLGSAAQLAPALAGAMPGVRFVGFGAPPGTATSPTVSLLRCGRTIPLRPGMARGVVLGAEHTVPPWLDEGARLLLRGQRLVALTQGIRPPGGVEPTAEGRGMWVGMKR